MNVALAGSVVALRPIPVATVSTRAPTAVSRPARLALLGTGTVGSAFVARWERLAQRGLPLPAFDTVANSRVAVDGAGLPSEALRAANEASRRYGSDGSRDGVAVRDAATANAAAFGCWEPASLEAGDIVVDATASDAVASRHAAWLACGIHVVTANKLGAGAALERADAIFAAQREGRTRYGDAATVGAGLPLLRSLRELTRGGDRIHSVEGVLSGSLAWLFDRYDGMRPFSGFVREARDAGYTEPDPRIDLSGEDVRRKLLILARASGLPLRAEQVDVSSLVPEPLARASADQVDALLPTLDAALRGRYQQAYRDGSKLRFVGRFAVDSSGGIEASVGLRALPAAHPLCGGGGTDNRVAIRSCRYDAQPLVIQGPGAGAEVTAAALLDDVLRIAAD